MSPPHMQDFFVSHFDYTSENETRFQQLDPSPYRLSAHDYISRLTPSNMFPPGSINAKTPFWATIPIRAYSEDPSPPLLQVFRHPKLSKYATEIAYLASTAIIHRNSIALKENWQWDVWGDTFPTIQTAIGRGEYLHLKNIDVKREYQNFDEEIISRFKDTTIVARDMLRRGIERDVSLGALFELSEDPMSAYYVEGTRLVGTPHSIWWTVWLKADDPRLLHNVMSERFELADILLGSAKLQISHYNVYVPPTLTSTATARLMIPRTGSVVVFYFRPLTPLKKHLVRMFETESAIGMVHEDIPECFKDNGEFYEIDWSRYNPDSLSREERLGSWYVVRLVPGDALIIPPGGVTSLYFDSHYTGFVDCFLTWDSMLRSAATLALTQRCTGIPHRETEAIFVRIASLAVAYGDETNEARKLTEAQKSSISAMMSLVRGFRSRIREQENRVHTLFDLVCQHLGDKAFEKEFSLENLCDMAK